MRNTPITQFKQALEKYHSTYCKYFKSKMYDIDYGGCGVFAYLLKQPIETIINHLGLQDKVKVSYVFLGYTYDEDDLKHTRKLNRKCIKKFNKGLDNELDEELLNDTMAEFGFSHVMLKIKIGQVIWFLDSDSIFKSIGNLNYNTGYDIVFNSDDFDLLENTTFLNMWNDDFKFSNDPDGALEKIGKPLQIMANNLIKNL